MGKASFKDRRIVIGVTGCVAAYKSCGLASALVQAGAGVRVIMTAAAATLVGPKTFQALTGSPVVFPGQPESSLGGMAHVDLARWGELLVIAPCTANTLGKIACGLADEPVSTLSLAFRGPQLLIPAMNPAMWAKASVGRNVETLRKDGYRVMQPEKGRMACGEEGEGRMPAEESIQAEMLKLLP